MRPALLALAAAACATARPAPPPALERDDRLLLAEARRVAALVGDSLFPGWDDAPLALLLVGDSLEILVDHPRPSDDFELRRVDPVLGLDVRARPRTFAPNLLASFPAVGGHPTIVVGRPTATGKSPAEWVLAVLHERVHQLQMASPGYFAAVDSLDLSGGDQTGMWMLNYAFPYDDSEVAARFAALARIAADGAEGGATPLEVRDAYRALEAALEPADLRYLDLQIWQEGLARYSECRIARLAATGPVPPLPVAGIGDWTAAARAACEAPIAELRGADLARDQRIAFYPLGAALGLLLDETLPGWRARYVASRFDVGPLLDEAAGR